MATTIQDISEAHTTRLHAIKPGQHGTIWALCSSAESRLTQRLMALGFVPGTMVRVLRRAPLGDPTEYELRGTRISLRAQEAKVIIMREEPKP